MAFFGIVVLVVGSPFVVVFLRRQLALLEPIVEPEVTKPHDAKLN